MNSHPPVNNPTSNPIRSGIDHPLDIERVIFPSVSYIAGGAVARFNATWLLSESAYTPLVDAIQGKVLSYLARHPTQCSASHTSAPSSVDELHYSCNIGVVDPGFGGAILAALASQDKRYAIEGRAPPRLIFILPHQLASSEIVDTPQGPKILCSAGVTLHGTHAAFKAFTPPIPLDVIAGITALSVPEQLWLQEQGIRFLNTPASERLAKDKIATHALMERIGVPMAPYSVVRLHREDGTLDIMGIAAHVVGKMLTCGDKRIVIKPANGERGIAVAIDQTSSMQTVIESLHKCARYHKFALIEDAVPSFPLEIEGERLDWNIRALVSPEGVIDLEVRVDRWGGPVNKSLGAKVWELSTLLHVLQKRHRNLPFTEESLFSDIGQLGSLLCQTLQASYLGLDLIVPSSSTPSIVLLEVNGERSGGIETLYNLRSPSRALEPAHRLLSVLQLAASLPKAGSPINMDDLSIHNNNRRSPLGSIMARLFPHIYEGNPSLPMMTDLVDLLQNIVIDPPYAISDREKVLLVFHGLTLCARNPSFDTLFNRLFYACAPLTFEVPTEFNLNESTPACLLGNILFAQFLALRDHKRGNEQQAYEAISETVAACLALTEEGYRCACHYALRRNDTKLMAAIYLDNPTPNSEELKTLTFALETRLFSPSPA